MTEGPKSVLTSNDSGVALVIGNFDGVHRGHQALLRYTLELAKIHGLEAKVMTFEPHPAKVLSGQAPPMLTRLDRKLSLLRRAADDIDVIVQPFDHEFSTLSPRQFVERILVGLVRVRQLVVGKNFRFGKDRRGSVEDLRSLGVEFGFEAHSFALSGDEQGSFSSSRIRRWIAEGDLLQARELLGRPHAISGLVIRGDGRGASLGFATANLGDVEEQVPPHGVYASIAQLFDDEGSGVFCPAAVHVGPRPTVDRDETIEAHLLDYQGDLYGRSLRLHLLQRLRGLVRFDGLEALKAQIAADVELTRQLAMAAPSLDG